MEEREVLTNEETKEAVKELCMEAFPAIQKISELVKTSKVSKTVYVSISEDGYIDMSIQGTGWEMTRYEDGAPTKIRYNYTEELKVPDTATMSKEEENLVEISLAYADMATEFPKLAEIESTTWKQLFVKWSKEFEKSWDESENGDFYLDAIETFAKHKIAEYAGLETKQ